MTLLGLLASTPMHGYELRQQMKQHGMERWVDVPQGSVYPALQRMAADGFLDAVEVAPEGKRPTKTVYSITPAGRTEHLRLLRNAWMDPALSGFPVDVALFFIWFLPAEEIATLLSERIDRIDQRLALLADVSRHNEVAAASGLFELPEQHMEPYMAMLTDLLEHARVTLTTEREWATRVLERLLEGIYEFPNDRNDVQGEFLEGGEGLLTS
jgi:DNA-binding PadR family transcriptional regulator